MSTNKSNITPEIENRVLSIWQSVLDVKKIARDENFFDAGGNSLLMSKVHKEIKIQLGIPINIIDLFQFPTVGLLSKNIIRKYPQVLLGKLN
ncbi:phosphopantetheine-binding protein [Vibrio sp. Vb339]|uniref:phosphopantetheine-binding protein n=1 Tax=Vibrio sp. Vb339 TaxID=1192013 RepID=UPI0015553CF3|nr:phosphopantetheine-binding protein [Vibrio sp. Vb339]